MGEPDERGVKAAVTPGLKPRWRWPVECLARGPIRHVSAVRLHNMTVILGTGIEVSKRLNQTLWRIDMAIAATSTSCGCAELDVG